VRPLRIWGVEWGQRRVLLICMGDVITSPTLLSPALGVEPAELSDIAGNLRYFKRVWRWIIFCDRFNKDDFVTLRINVSTKVRMRCDTGCPSLLSDRKPLVILNVEARFRKKVVIRLSTVLLTITLFQAFPLDWLRCWPDNNNLWKMLGFQN